ncbi:MAG: hypothetical protein HQM10_04195 [Candidatus Riflebacteria bacterium]|nr:hypothetical protein [Candidatus Riflebacteria bacterium]
MNTIIRCFVLVYILSAMSIGCVFAENPQFPVNESLLKAFDDIKVAPGDINTKVRYLWENDEAWYARWKMVENAKETIDCTYFNIYKDIFGQSFLGLLLKKARQGIKIRLMIDWRVAQTAFMKGMDVKLKALASLPNVQIKLYNSVTKSLASLFTDFRKLIASNHDKILIIDGLTSMAGGRNIGADYFVGKGEWEIVYRDSDILMLGKHVADQLKKAFDEEWNLLKNVVIKSDEKDVKREFALIDLAYKVMNRYMQGQGTFSENAENLSSEMKEALHEMTSEITGFKNISSYAGFELWHGERSMPVKIIDKHSRCSSFNGLTPALINFIDNCKHEIVIQNSYMILTEKAEEALKRASQRGVKIIFHSNSAGSTDFFLTVALFMNDFPRLSKEMPTMRFFAAPTPNERLHSKVFIFDSQITVIGSYNVDPVSEQIYSEVGAVVKDPEFGVMTRMRLQNDMKSAVEYKLKIQPDGKIESQFGPENHLDQKTLKKLNFFRKLGWLRPLV